MQSDNVVVIELMQYCYFPIRPLRVDVVVKGIKYFLKGQLLLSSSVNNPPDIAIRPVAQHFLGFVELQDSGVELSPSFLYAFLHRNYLRNSIDYTCSDDE